MIDSRAKTAPRLKTPCRHFFIAPFDIEHHMKSWLLLRNDIVFRHKKPKIFHYNGLFSCKKSIIMPGRSLRFKMALSAYRLGSMMLSVSLAQHYEEEKEDDSDNSKESEVSFDADPVTAAPFLPQLLDFTCRLDSFHGARNNSSGPAVGMLRVCLLVSQQSYCCDGTASLHIPLLPRSPSFGTLDFPVCI
jgi:hypothetical protein